MAEVTILEILQRKDERIGELERDRDEWKDAAQTRGAEASGLMRDCDSLNSDLTAERERVKRLSAPVSDKEWVFHGGVNFSAGHKRALSAIIESRATSPIPAPADKETKQ